jgi:hypothetical protein
MLRARPAQQDLEMTITLDFSLLPPLDHSGILIALDSDLQCRFAELGAFPTTLARINGALMQFHSVAAKRPNVENESFIRCGLAEFRSLGQCAKHDRRQAGFPGDHRRMDQSRNPLIQAMLLLCNLNLHARSCKAGSRRTTVISTLGEPHDYTYDAVILEPVDAEELLRVRHARKRYSRVEIEKVLDWIMEKQRNFGISEVFRQGVQGYCREVLMPYL